MKRIAGAALAAAMIAAPAYAAEVTCQDWKAMETAINTLLDAQATLVDTASKHADMATLATIQPQTSGWQQAFMDLLAIQAKTAGACY